LNHIRHLGALAETAARGRRDRRGTPEEVMKNQKGPLPSRHDVERRAPTINRKMSDLPPLGKNGASMAEGGGGEGVTLGRGGAEVKRRYQRENEKHSEKIHSYISVRIGAQGGSFIALQTDKGECI